MSKKRTRSATAAEANAPQPVSVNTDELEKETVSLKECLNEVSEILMCPITLALMVRPVFASDGYLYEKAALLHWMAQKKHPGFPTGLAEPIRSPVTNQPITADEWIYAPQVRRTIKLIVESGALSPGVANEWLAAAKTEEEQSIKYKKMMDQTTSQLTAPRVSAFRWLGASYRDGLHGVEVDKVKAFEWLKKGADENDPFCCCSVGIQYFKGLGVIKNTACGLAMLHSGAALGSEHACAILGYISVCGSGSLKIDKDNANAARWFKQMRSSATKDTTVNWRKWAHVFMNAHASGIEMSKDHPDLVAIRTAANDSSFHIHI